MANTGEVTWPWASQRMVPLPGPLSGPHDKCLKNLVYGGMRWNADGADDAAGRDNPDNPDDPDDPDGDQELEPNRTPNWRESTWSKIVSLGAWLVEAGFAAASLR